MPDPVRVRYAPSPTGLPHVGNIRTALFNWLFARHNGGVFVVRIEDTDAARKVEGAVEAILDGLRWLNLDWDEGPEVGGEYGPYFQSERLDLYHKYSQQLTKLDRAYTCYCSSQRLAEMRKEQQRRKEPPRYDRQCRNLTETEKRAKGDTDTPVVRFKVPAGESVTFTDLVREEVTFETNVLDDFVILKSDGYPTYHLANVVDDHFMEISHVMRAEEWLSSTPRHLLLYQALGFEPPKFAHLPMILGPDRSKMSKRHGSTALPEYENQGYLLEAMTNFLSLLGWALDDKTELFSRDELVEHFTIERVGKTGAIFDADKLNWMNGVYIRKLSVDQLVERGLPFLERDLPPEVPRPLDQTYVARIIPLVQDRARTLGELAELTDFFFVAELEYDSTLLIPKKMDGAGALRALVSAEEKLGCLESFDQGNLEGLLRPLAEELEVKTGQLFGALRVATTGRTAAPPLFETMEVLGKKRCMERIGKAIGALRG